MNPETPFVPENHHQAHPYNPPAYPQYPPQPPQPQPQPPSPITPNGVQPTPVVKVLSPFGVEYVFLTISLIVSAISLISALLLLVNGETGFSSLAFPTASLVVALPVFGFLFLRLKRMELRMPELKLDASKRRSTQFTQIVAFTACLFTLIGFVVAVFAKLGGTSEISVGKAALNALCIIAVSGGILAYYWRDEHITKR